GATRTAAAKTRARRAQHGATSTTPHRGCAVMLAADRVTLDAHTARYRLAARGGCSHPTHEGMRSFPRTAPRGDIIADRLGGQNRWPLTGREPLDRAPPVARSGRHASPGDGRDG